jgi:hypothetical protein
VLGIAVGSKECLGRDQNSAYCLEPLCDFPPFVEPTQLRIAGGKNAPGRHPIRKFFLRRKRVQNCVAKPSIEELRHAEPSSTACGHATERVQAQRGFEELDRDIRPGHCQINLCRAKRARRQDARSNCRDRIPPLVRRLGSEDPERRSRDEMTLKIESVMDGDIHAKEALGGSS